MAQSIGDIRRAGQAELLEQTVAAVAILSRPTTCRSQPDVASVIIACLREWAAVRGAEKRLDLDSRCCHIDREEWKNLRRHRAP